MRLKYMPIGFWNYVDCGVLDKTAVSDWKELGISLAMSFEYDFEKNKKEEMLEVLDECARQNISVIVCDTRTHWKTYMKYGEERFVQLLRGALEDFGSHKAVFGFHVGDEPDKDMWEAAIRSCSLQKQYAPHLHPFVNFFPYWKGTGFEAKLGFEGARYEDKLVDFIKRSGLEFVMYDCYTQLCDYNSDMEIDKYFYNLNLFGRVAMRCGVPLWNTIGCVGLEGTRVPNEDDLRWQLGTSLMHGCTGFFWFFIYGRRLHECFRLSPFDLYYNKTETYDRLARQNRIFTQHYAQKLIGYELEKVYHYGRAYGGTEMFVNGCDDIIRDISHLQNEPLAAAKFIDRKSGKRIVALCNLSQKNPELGRVYFYGKYKKYDYGWWLAPGQIYLIPLFDEE